MAQLLQIVLSVVLAAQMAGGVRHQYDCPGRVGYTESESTGCMA
jgi:hypothetical protein